MHPGCRGLYLVADGQEVLLARPMGSCRFRRRRVVGVSVRAEARPTSLHGPPEDGRPSLPTDILQLRWELEVGAISSRVVPESASDGEN